MPRKHPPFPVLCSLATHEHARVKENMARGSYELPPLPFPPPPSIAVAQHSSRLISLTAWQLPCTRTRQQHHLHHLLPFSLPHHLLPYVSAYLHHLLHHHNPSPIAISTARQHKKKLALFEPVERALSLNLALSLSHSLSLLSACLHSH